MNLLNYLIICISLYLLVAIKFDIMYKKFKDNYPIAEVVEKNTEFDWNKESRTWLYGIIALTCPVVNIFIFIYLFTRTQKQLESEWLEELNL